MDANTDIHFVQILPGLFEGGAVASDSLAPAHRVAEPVLAWSATACKSNELDDAWSLCGAADDGRLRSMGKASHGTAAATRNSIPAQQERRFDAALPRAGCPLRTKLGTPFSAAR